MTAIRHNTNEPPVRAHSAGDAVTEHHPEIVFKRAYSSFLRVADLNLDETISMRSESVDSEELNFPNFHQISVDPPPGVKLDPKERWICLDDGEGNHAPIAPVAVSALARSGLASSFDTEMWVSDGKTSKILKHNPSWNDFIWQKDGAVVLPKEGTNEKDVLVFSGTFKHGLYGSELPAIRSVGIVDMDPKALLELLIDSDRVKEYNKLCLGRTDVLTLQSDMDEGAFGGITKVCKTQTKPPLVRKNLFFSSLLHARKLEDDSGFKLITRAVTLPDSKEDLANALKSEILLGATILKRIEGDNNKCLFIAVNHLRSPMVPIMIAKRIGLQAATGFINDLRNCNK
mmetsp:Transcript_547/g.1602  ORF Transcript_547/g.1602 Transcript_547/m.1602 type:complete len:344 (+) Transcript_547:96-1127(+)